MPCKPPGIRAAAQLMHDTLPAAIPLLQGSTRTGWWPAAAAWWRTHTSCRRLRALPLGPKCWHAVQQGSPLSTTSTAPTATSLPPVRGVLVGVCWCRLLLADLTIGSTTAGLDRHTRASMPACYLQVQSGCLCSSPVAAAGGARSGIQISQLPGRTRLDAPWPRQVRLRMPLDFGPAGEPAAAAE